MKIIDLRSLTISNTKSFEFVMVLVFIIFSSLSARAQFFEEMTCPQVTINLTHPPDLGIKVSKIAFGPATGTCSDQIIDAIQSDFVSNNIEVIDRANLTAILAEHQFTFSGYVDQTSAAAIGKILGPSALVFVKVQVCETKVDKLVGKKTVYYKDKTTGEVPVYYARTRVNLRGSIQAVDLATGRIFGSQPFEFSPERTNESDQGYPDPPAEFDIQKMAFQSVVSEIHQMFLPWTEPLTLYYYDNKDHDLNQAYQAMKAGNLDLAFDLSKKNLESCKSDAHIKDKLKSHAYYNMGMSYLLREEYDKAMEFFQEAAKLHSGNIITSAMSKCQKAKEIQISRQRVEQKASFEAEKKMAEQNKAVQAEQANTMTNKDVIKLSQMKLSNAIILQKIKSSKCNFDTSADALGILTKAGVNEDIIVAMMSK